MASPVGQFRPWRLIVAFGIVTAVLYALVFFTKGSNTPKLGIDLQGGTQVTLTAQTLDKKNPSPSAMQQAQEIMTKRVNGSGVVGAEVKIDGANHLVVTAPGNDPLTGRLTAAARLNIRPHLAQGYDFDVVKSAQSQAPTSGTAAAGPASSGVASSGATTSGPVTSGPVASGAVVKPESSPANSTAAVTSPARLRAAAPATTSAQSAAAPATAAASVPTAAGSTVPSPSAAPSSSAAAAASQPAGSAAPASSAAASSGATPPTTVTKAAWPLPGSDTANPNQPAAKTAAGWAAWLTAAQSAVQGSSVACSDVSKSAGLDDPNRPVLACADPEAGQSLLGAVLVLDKTLVPGDQISGATAGLDTSGVGGWLINVTFNNAGYKTWSTYTANNVHKQTAFVLDGVVISDPQIQQAINTVTTQVSGSFNQKSATALADSLNFGALPLSFTPGTATSISAQLGFQYLQAGLIAGGIGLLLVVVYCLIYYRLLGLITIGSLVLSGGLVYAIMVLLGRWIGLSLDLAGIAGLIVAIGITADSFVIYFERLKDEVREGRSFRSAVPRGWERAKRTILSADAVSILSAVILYVVAIGDVKGFAFTLGLSTVLDLVVVYMVTHPMVALASGSNVFNSARFSGLGAVAAAGIRQRAATARLTAKEA